MRKLRQDAQKGGPKIATNGLNNMVKDCELRLHPIIKRLVDKETLEKTGARQARMASTSEQYDS